MKFYIVCLLVVAFILASSDALSNFQRGRHRGGNLGGPSKESNALVVASEDLWFTQLLDHFAPTNSQTWQQRYFVNDEFWNGTGPVFIMIGGEGEASAKWMNGGAWIDYARQLGALCFQLEHRYYGKSQPTPDLSTENLMFLASESALADLAYFITVMNGKYKLEGKKWIAFGGSYPGSLAAWVRHRYAHLVHGSISTSGPLLAKVDFTEYMDVVRDSLATFSDACVTAVKKSFDEVDVLLKHRIGQKSLNEKFNLCDTVEESVDNALDIANLYESLSGNFAGVVQYNKDNSPHAKLTIDDLCQVMVDESHGAPVSRLAKVNEMVMQQDKQKCLDFKYQKMVDEMKNVSWYAETAEGGRQWFYQTCTEFGFYQTSEDPNALFGNRFNVSLFTQQCMDIFGEKYKLSTVEKGAMRTNIEYGALNPKTTNVLYVHGSIDPWHALGLTQSNDPNMPTIYVEGTAHCANMYEPRDADLPQLKDARVKIFDFISNILKNDF